MKKRFFTIFLALVAGVVTLFASDTQVDGIFYVFNSSSKTATVTYRGSSYSSYSNEYTGAVIIPASVTYNNSVYSVTSIGSNAFSGCSGLTSVTIVNSVTSVGDYAFEDCSGLTSVTIPNSVTRIGHWAFYGCTGLTSVTIGNSVTSIGYEAFDYCYNLTSVTLNSNDVVSNSNNYNNMGTIFGEYVETYIIGDNVTSIGDFAFEDCIGLTSVTIPNSVTSIGEGAFYGCTGLTSVTIPNSVTSIGESAFGYCTGLTSVIIPNSVTSIGNFAFSDCTGLTSPIYNAHVFAFMPTSYFGAYTIPDGIESIAGSAFFDCVGLTSVTIPNSVTSIGNYAFYGCSNLPSVTIPNSVTNIGKGAFAYCTGLTSLTIPNSVTSIDGMYRNDDGYWVGAGAFQGCSSLTSLTIGNGVEFIGDSAFARCGSLASVSIDANAIVGKAYSDYCNLKDIFGTQVTEYIIGNSVTSIGIYAFARCTGLTSVTIGNSVTSIGGSAFDGCSSLTSVTIGNSVTCIGGSAFDGCSSLTSMYITDLVAWCDISAGCWVGNYYDIPFSCVHDLYLNDKLITELIIPNNVTSIGEGAFAYSSIKSVVVSGGCQSIGDGTFNGCDSLTNVVIQKGCQSIGDRAFFSSDNITSITIPSTLTNIGNLAFTTGKIETMYNYATTPQDMSSYSGYEMLYRGILALATLYVPQQSINAYKSAYFWKYFGNILPVQTPEPQAIENISDDDSFNASEGKILRDGQIFILRGEKVYTLDGQLVR